MAESFKNIIIEGTSALIIFIIASQKLGIINFYFIEIIFIAPSM